MEPRSRLIRECVGSPSQRSAEMSTVLNSVIGRLRRDGELALVGLPVRGPGERAERHQPGAVRVEQPGLQVVAARRVGDAVDPDHQLLACRPGRAPSTVPAAAGSAAPIGCSVASSASGGGGAAGASA